MSESRSMVFQRFGRSHHLRIVTADDLAHLLTLDEAHWVATGAPIDTINCDRTFLDHVDSDHNKRIMCFEVREAVEWFFANVRDLSGASEGATVLRLDAINPDSETGRRVRESTSKILDRLEIADSPEISLEQVRTIKSAIEATAISEAGVVLPEAAEDLEIRQMLTRILATVGGAEHPSGRPGVNQEKLDAFLAGALAFLDWRKQGRVDSDLPSSPIMPLGARTPDLFAVYAALQARLDQYFAQCQAVAFDPRTAGRASADEATLAALDLSDPEAIRTFIRQASLATPRPDGTLAFDEPLNPAYEGLLVEFRDQVLAAVLGEAVPVLSREKWLEVKKFFAAHEAWVGAKAGHAVEPLGAEPLQEYLEARFRAGVEALIAESTETAFVLDNIRLAEKLILYQAYLVLLANNFVSFPHLYDPARRALFEMGTLVVDGRRFCFSIRADNRSAHAKVAKTGNMFVMYVEILPTGGAKKYEVAVPVSSGGKGNLCVGKRGVFQDVRGNESDARIVQIIENPISVFEAVTSPFRRLARMLSGKIESITTSAQKEFDTKAGAVLNTSGKAKKPPAQPAKSSGSGLLAGGLLMGGGVAVAAVTSAIAYITKTLSDVDASTILLGVVIAILAVMLPTAVVGLLKLRKRDLSAILEGSGWAINARMRLTIRLARFFTRRPSFPGGARGLARHWLRNGVLMGIAAVLIAALCWYVFWRRPAQKPAPTTAPSASTAPAQTPPAKQP